MSETKRDLEVYIKIDLPDDYDIVNILKCIEIYIKTKQTEYNMAGLYNYTDKSLRVDVIERGLHTFSKMFEDYKLKTKSEVWFIYLSLGTIQRMNDEMTLLLLNRNPGERECYYTINRNKLDMKISMDKAKKMESIKVLTKSLDELFSTTKTIKYKNIL